MRRKVINDPSKPLLEGALGVGASAISMLEPISQAAARHGDRSDCSIRKTTEEDPEDSAEWRDRLSRRHHEAARQPLPLLQRCRARVADGIHVADRMRCLRRTSG